MRHSTQVFAWTASHRPALCSKSQLETLEPNQLNHYGANLLTCDNYQIKTNAKRFELWERSYAGQVALGIAIDYAMARGLENISQRIKRLTDQMLKN
jgi:selenocysteine lyase/cysteine desulfurase